ncbi:MAG TPA: DNA-3-methyladenine glycosylase [Agriterribacter sp.]|nr:DNA-3-methyladenine glycosylase [Agriterribacter sp.]
MSKLDYSFYNRSNVVSIAKELLGKILVTRWDGRLTSGRIVETEAYEGVTDRASHAWNGRRTKRTEIMYGNGGSGYVYLCYGIHQLFNVVTNVEEIPHAVLIRAVEPLEGIDIMLQRRRKQNLDRNLTSGPGNVSAALGINTKHSGISLVEDTIFIVDDDFKLNKKDIVTTTRIGVDYAGEDALLPYRFIIQGNAYVSGRKYG